ncbi:hypothetical protein WG66_013057 [Moniliophthora roreri]|nr:hypothetical protein WG66_013057 [Moniliophthora roreri]
MKTHHSLSLSSPSLWLYSISPASLATRLSRFCKLLQTKSAKERLHMSYHRHATATLPTVSSTALNATPGAGSTAISPANMSAHPRGPVIVGTSSLFRMLDPLLTTPMTTVGMPLSVVDV